jgi:hypothetical protein
MAPSPAAGVIDTSPSDRRGELGSETDAIVSRDNCRRTNAAT